MRLYRRQAENLHTFRVRTKDCIFDEPVYTIQTERQEILQAPESQELLS
jgi:hypothetical protein